MPALATLPLAEIVFWLGVWIFCLLCLKIAQAFFSFGGGAIGWIPFVGGWAKHRVEDIAHKIASTMAGAMGFADQRVAAAIHDAARLSDWIGREIASHSDQLVALAQLLTGQLPASYLLKEIHRLTHLGDQGAQALRGIGHDVLPRIRTVERGIGADVMPRLHSLDREIGRVIAHDVPLLRDQVRGLEDGAINTFRWIRSHPLSAATAAFVGAVAYALARLGMGWPRCENWKKIGKHVCGLPLGLIEDLLAVAIDVLLIADVCKMTKLMIGVAESRPVQDALRGIILGVDELMLCQGVDLPKPLSGYTAGLPPAQPFALLPAA